MKQTNLTRRQDWACLGLLAALVLWFGHEMVWSGKVPFFRDLSTYFYPMRFTLTESFKAGELPLWDRHMGMGFPLLADFQSGSFYVPHICYLMLPFFTAVRATFLFHYLVAATGSFMLCREWNYSPYLALTGAILFTLGGPMISLTNLLNHFQAAVWLPWVLLLGERCLKSPSWWRFLGLTLALLLQFLAGSPEIYSFTLGLLLLDGIRLRTKQTGLTYQRIFFLFLASNVLVALLAMVQILPTLELFLNSRGETRIPYGEVARWSLHPLNLINLFFLDKEVSIDTFLGARLFFARDLPLILSQYMGAISLLGIFLWLFRGSLKEKGILLGLIFFSLVIAIGSYSPVFPTLFKYVPFFGFFRYPEKFLFFTQALLLFIALKGLFQFLECDDLSYRRPFFLLASVCGLLLLTYVYLCFDTTPLSRFIARETHNPLLSSSTIDSAATVLVHLERQIGLTLGILLLLFLIREAGPGVPIFKALLVGLVFIDLNSAHRPYQYFLDPSFVDKGPKIIANKEDLRPRLFYTIAYPSHPNLHPSYYPVQGPLSFQEFQSKIYSNLWPNTGVFHGFDYMQEIDALARQRYVDFLRFANGLPAPRLYRLLGVLNVSYINSSKPLPDGDITLVRHFAEYPAWLYTINRTIPRVYIVSRVIVEEEAAKILDRLSGTDFDPFGEVVLPQPVSLAAPRDFHAQASIARYTNRDVTIQTSLSGAGVLVLADSFYPGWRVYVDGKQQEILRANFFFRGVLLPKGEHRVEFRYEPRSFKIGLTVSLLTLCGLLFFGCRGTILRRRAGLSI
jgi:hypothetical protein